MWGLLVVVLVLILGPGEPPGPERMVVTAFKGEERRTYVLAGGSHTVIPAPVAAFTAADISPISDELVYDVADQWRPSQADIWKVNMDGSHAVNLTDRAGLGGINCHPRWSPDGARIAFKHSYLDPEVASAEGLLPCMAGFEIWIMNLDGTEARRVSREGMPYAEPLSWSPDGSHLLCAVDLPAVGPAVISMDVEDGSYERLPNVIHDAAWSPDGSQIASGLWELDLVDGEPGMWCQLRLTDADGGRPRTLWQQFVKESDWRAHRSDFPDDIFNPGWVTPHYPAWSPGGDRIAFLAAIPFDPDVPVFREQVEVWIYDLASGELIRATNDTWAEHGLNWRGPS